jgi:hypothetical protein
MFAWGYYGAALTGRMGYLHDSTPDMTHAPGILTYA